MVNIKNKIFVTVLLVVLVTSGAVYGLYAYNAALKNDLTASTGETLLEVTAQQKLNFTSKISADISTIKNLAFMASSLSREKEEVVRSLKTLLSNSNFEYIIIANTKGEALVSDGTVLDISKEEYFVNAINGTTAISNPKKSQIRDAVIVPIATPIYTDGNIVGVLIGSYTAEKLRDLFLPSFGGKGCVYVTDSEGNILVRPQNEYTLFVNQYVETNLYGGLKRATVAEGYAAQEEMQNDLAQGRSGYTKIILEDSSEFISYSASGVNDWNIFLIVPEAHISGRVAVITGRAATFAVVVMVLFLLLLLYMLSMQRRRRTERELHTAQLEQLAYYDEVTGLPNLIKFKKLVQDMLVQNASTPFVMTKLDVVNFKMINEIFGFEVGDKVVVAVAEHILQVLRGKGLEIGSLTRVTADEFLLIDVSDSGAEELIKRSEAFEENFNKQVSAMLGNHRVEFRYGGYFLEIGETDVMGAMEKTNIAHYLAKSQKNNKICFYDDLFKRRIVRETEIENKMESALENKEFKVYLQAKYDLSSEEVVGAEALVRWQTPNGQMILPNEFIPLFERNGFVVKLDLYMFERVCEMIRGWMDDGKPVVAVSVNFSRAHLADDKFVSQLEEIADRHVVPKKYLEIELTESTILDNEELLEKLLNSLHNIGFTLSMDDFGIGYSSLGLLKNLPVDVVKIDRSFFVNNKYKSRAKTVIESIMAMAKKLGILTVAEGVESKDHIDLLREVGCDVVQGYYYSVPIPAEEFHRGNCQFAQSGLPIQESPFDLEAVGNVSLGRAYLGCEMPVEVYRLFQFTLREVLNRLYGEGEAVEVFRMSGRMAGSAYAKEYLDLSTGFTDFIIQLKNCLQSAKIGVLDVEKIDDVGNTMIITVRDDLDCSGVPNSGKTLCQYDEGFIAGVLYTYTQKEYAVTEVDCWGTGADVCRFRVNPK